MDTYITESSPVSAFLAQGHAPHCALPAGSAAGLEPGSFRWFASLRNIRRASDFRLGSSIAGLRTRITLFSRIAAPASALLVLNTAAVVGLYRFLFTHGPLWKIWNLSKPEAKG